MEIDWAKIIEKPDAKHKVDGTLLLKYRSMTEKLNNEVDSLKKKIAELEKQKGADKATIAKLQSEANELRQSSESMEKELQAIVSEKENDFQSQQESIQNELENLKQELETVNQQASETQQKFVEIESVLNEKESQIAELESQNQDLSNKITEFAKNSDEINELNSKLAELQNTLQEKDSEIGALDSKLQEEVERIKVEMEAKYKTEIESLNQQHAQEMQNQKESYITQIEELEGKFGMSAEQIAKSEKDLLSGTIFLRYTGSDFVLVRKKPDQGIALVLDQQEMKWLMVWDASVGFVERRSAERVARSIAKAGWALPSGARVGFGFDLEMQGEHVVPDRLLRDQHEYMD